MSRHQPLNGADSAEAYVLRPYSVFLVDRFDDHDRRSVRIPAALGPNDAKSQARELHPGYVALEATEVAT